VISSKAAIYNLLVGIGPQHHGNHQEILAVLLAAMLVHPTAHVESPTGLGLDLSVESSSPASRPKPLRLDA
jgi:hypothetical protein